MLEVLHGVREALGVALAAPLVAVHLFSEAKGWLANDTAALRVVAPDAQIHLDSGPSATIDVPSTRMRAHAPPPPPPPPPPSAPCRPRPRPPCSPTAPRAMPRARVRCYSPPQALLVMSPSHPRAFTPRTATGPHRHESSRRASHGFLRLLHVSATPPYPPLATPPGRHAAMPPCRHAATRDHAPRTGCAACRRTITPPLARLHLRIS